MPPKKDTAASGRRKSDKVDKTSDRPGLITLKVTPAKLREKLAPETVVPTIKEDTPMKDAPANKDSPTTSNTLPAPASTADNASDSNANTPANAGTPQPTTMGPPAEGPKKKGVKRAAVGPNGEPKPRGKPGPKKKARLDDGTIDPTPRPSLGHKLGPKANQGAINAGLRALDRSGKPCRKWAKGSFTLKSFTGVVWEIPRWTAPPRPKPVESTPENSAAASAEGSVEKKDGQTNGTAENKENKDAPKDQPQVNGDKPDSNKENEQVAKSDIKSDNSNSGGDVEMQDASSVPASAVPSAPPSAMASSPAPTPAPSASAPIAAAS